MKGGAKKFGPAVAKPEEAEGHLTMMNDPRNLRNRLLSRAAIAEAWET